MSRRLRCAIYTRKSTEEGLDQSFNSLDAQRDACAAYIKSQAHEGWSATKVIYDDGGFSGGNMDRPALQRLLADVDAGRVDVIVVYKVDRLTRSLADFARIVEILDRAGASFVSVTQSFNTTTSMGRLTLNVLLSFAQFEREVTGERIRDKIAASKAKGMWMGGVVPLGYDVRERALVVNPTEAALVQHIFVRYLALGSTVLVAEELRRDGLRTKRWTSRSGREIGGCMFWRGAINHILKARIYRGEIEHKGKVYPGAHQAIIDLSTWDAVQAKMRGAAPTEARARFHKSTQLLTGIIFDDAGNRMSPSHTSKKGRRYSYYCSAAVLRDKRGQPGAIQRLAAFFADDAVIAAVGERLRPSWCADQPIRMRVREAVLRVTVKSSGIVALVRAEAISDAGDNDEPFAIIASGTLRRRGNAIVIDRANAWQAPKLSSSLIRAVVLARQWADDLATGKVASAREIARQHGLCHLYVGKLLPLAFLAPDLVQCLLEGRQPRGLSISNLLAAPLPLSWAEQRARFHQGI